MSEEKEEITIPDLSQMGIACKMQHFVSKQLAIDYYEVYRDEDLKRHQEYIDTIKEQKPEGHKDLLKAAKIITKAVRNDHTKILESMRVEAEAFRALAKVSKTSKIYLGMCNLSRQATQYALAAQNPEEFVQVLALHAKGAFDVMLQAFSKSDEVFDRDLGALTDSLDRRIEEDKAAKAHEATMTVEDIMPKGLKDEEGS
ncbi:MAG: hypothetical protein COB15_09540 [Flavobacteriales bacterium]|nr:MAG: hypothetical protein COB15_09540 [Flavobacteriales bacterium]